MWVTWADLGNTKKQTIARSVLWLEHLTKTLEHKLCQAVSWLCTDVLAGWVVEGLTCYHSCSLSNFLQTRLQSVHCYCHDWTSRLLLSASEVKQVVISLVPMIFKELSAVCTCWKALFYLRSSKTHRNWLFFFFQKQYLNFVIVQITDYVLTLWSAFYDLVYSDWKGIRTCTSQIF